MKIRHLHPEEAELWDSYVLRHPHGHFMQSAEWGTFKSKQGWKPYYIIVEDGGSIAGGTLIQVKRLSGSGRSLFYSPRGPLVPTDDNRVLTALCAEIRRLASIERAIFWRIDPYVTGDDAGDFFVTAGFRTVPMDWSYWNAPKYLMHLTLDGVIDHQFMKISSTARNEVRQASRNGVIVEHGGKQDLDDFFSLMMKTAEKKKIVHHELTYYRDIYAALEHCGMAQLFLAKKDGVTGSAGISVRFGATAWLLYLVSDYTIKYSNRALQWEMVKWAVDSGCTTYDFRGAATNFPPQETDPGYGVFKFKKSFGADVAIMAGYYDMVFVPAWYRLFRFVEQSVLPRAMALRARLKR
jgi:lipid II:glycine glycyltransferase (peptidoglycan interpeptide bridge formation enzyme)